MGSTDKYYRLTRRLRPLLLSAVVVTYSVLLGGVAVNANNYRIKQQRLFNTGSQVLVCTSPNAYAYHSHECRGLKRCSHNIVTMSRQAAEKKGYTPCKICYC